jgi:acetyltransferase-like isoleucine patch superfamily enzyme
MSMIQRIKKALIKRLYYHLKDFDNSLNSSSIPENNGTIGANTRFEKMGKIFNFLNDKSKVVLGDNCLIHGELLIYGHGGKIKIGDFVFLGEGSKIWSSLNIEIGNNVLISHNVNIHDNNSHPLNTDLRREQMQHILTNGLPDTSFDTNEAAIIIEDDVWIGYNAAIFKGVRVGKGSIIAAGTYVFKDVPPYSVVMGNPGVVVRSNKS